MNRLPDGIGRTIVIAVIAGGLFAGFLALAPRLTASETEAAPATSTSTLPLLATSSLPGISDPVVAVPDTAPDVQVTVTTAPALAASSTTSATAPAATSTTVVPPSDGSIELTVDARNASDADSDGAFVEGDEIQWRFQVTNTSDEELWGAYVYLELHGPADCDVHNLLPGESTDCWIVTSAVEGTHTAKAWATAWTTERIVADDLEFTFQVTL
jgi:hypothetical protein